MGQQEGSSFPILEAFPSHPINEISGGDVSMEYCTVRCIYNFVGAEKKKRESVSNEGEKDS